MMAHALAQLLSDDAAWNAFVAASETPSHLQLTAWARVKASNGWRARRVVADGGSGPIGAQVLIRRLGPGPFALGYIPRGPIAAAFDEPSLAEFGTALRWLARRERLTHVTVEPGIEDRSVTGLLGNARYRPTDAVQQTGSRLIDLTRPEETLWGDLRSTTRRYVSRARRDGCTVREGGAADLAAFHAILAETARRGGFIHRTEAAYRDVYEAFSVTGGARLLFAHLADGTPAAAKLLVSCGGRVAQPNSGMTAQGAESRANYLLEWETIRLAAAAGDHTYDMWGLANPGIAYFKAGFGGHEVHYDGAWDLVTLPLLREAIVRGRRAYVWAARRRRGLAAGGHA